MTFTSLAFREEINQKLVYTMISHRSCFGLKPFEIKGFDTEPRF